LFFNQVRDLVVNSLSDSELDEIDTRIENFILACIGRVWPICNQADGIGQLFDGTPTSSLSHAMVVARKTTCVKTTGLIT